MKFATALIVDDNADLAENLCEILATIPGYSIRTLTAANAAEARAHCLELHAKLDVAFVDLHLPDADGLELVQEIQRSCQHCEVLIITGDATVESAARAVRHGAFAYVTKPFAPADLVQTTSAALARALLVREREALRFELEESERRHRELVEAVPAFVLALDAEGRIALWNQQLEAATGRARGEMLGLPGRDLVGQGGDRKLELPGGGYRLVRWQLAELPGSSGAVTYALGMDVTEERSMMRRTLRAERLAAVGTLAAGLAHEVRNPLNSASLQLQVLRRRIDKGNVAPEALLPVIAIVDDEIRRLGRLVNDFLAFARPSPMSVNAAPLDELVGSVVVQLEPEVAAEGCALTLDLLAPVRVDVDTERLRQVLLNLVRNAIEASSGGGTIIIRTRPADAEGFASVEIEDDGPGIPEDAPVFDAFYTTKTSGTGLGLAIVHRIIEEHGGTVGFESRPGRTCFSIRLPQTST